MKARHLFHFLLVALLAVTMVTVLGVSAAAEDPAATDYFEVLDEANSHIGYYETPEAALAAVQEGYTLKLLRNYTATEAITLDVAVAYNLDATGFTLTANILQSAGTVTVKGGSFTVASGILWQMEGITTSLTVEGGSFTSTTAANTTASSTVGTLFLFHQTAGTVRMDNATLIANGTLFYCQSGTQDNAQTEENEYALTSVDLTLGANMTGTTKKYVVYSQWLAKGNITFGGGNWTGGRVLHICGGGDANATGTVTFTGNGTYHSLYMATAAARPADYNTNCLVQNTNDVGGIYVGRHYELTITGGDFRFDGPGLVFQNSNKKLEITGGSFVTTQTNSTEKQQVMFFVTAVTNPANIVKNARFESYGSYRIDTDRGIFVCGDKVTLTVGEGTYVWAHGAAHAIGLFGAGPHNIIFEGGFSHSDTGAAYFDSGHNELGTGNTNPITFCGMTFESGRLSDNGVLQIHSGAQYLINGGTYRHTAVDHSKTTANVLFNIYGYAGVTIQKGTFVCGNFLRVGGGGTTADKSATIIIAPEKDEDVTVSGGSGSSPMIWYQGNTGYFPTLIIKGGIFTQNGTTGYILVCNNGGMGNTYILGGQFNAPNKSDLGVWTWNNFNLHVYGGTFTAKERFLNIEHQNAASIIHSINLYGQGEQTITWPNVNAFGKAALEAAGLLTNAEANQFTFTATGVMASATMSMFTSTTAEAGHQGVLNIYGGTYRIEEGNASNLFGDNTSSKYGTINIYGGTFTNAGGISRMFKITGGHTFNFYGGTFTNEEGGSDIIATATGACGTFNFYGAGTYNGITTEGVTFIHRGGNVKQSIYESDNATTETVNIYGGTFISDVVYGDLFSVRHTGGFALEGGMFIGNSILIYLSGAGSATVGNISFKTAAGPGAVSLAIGTGALTFTGTTGTLTYFADSAYERTVTWKEFVDGVQVDHTSLLDVADENGNALGVADSITSIEDALSLAAEAGSNAIVLLDHIMLSSPWVITQDLTVYGNGFAIYAVNNFGSKAAIQITEGANVCFVDTVFHGDRIFSANSGTLTLNSCTVETRGNIVGTDTVGGAFTLSGNATVILTGTVLSAPVGGYASDTDGYGTYFRLLPGFTGNVSLDAACKVNGGLKLIFATNLEDVGSAGSVSVTGVSIGVSQYILYSQALCNTSLSLVNCSFDGARILHVCAATNTTVQPGAEYVIEGGTYTTGATGDGGIYLGVYRGSYLTVRNATITGNTIFTIRSANKILIDGGKYVSTGSNKLFFLNEPAGKDNVIQNVVFEGQNQILWIDNGSTLTVKSGTFKTTGNIACVATSGNAQNSLTIMGGTFETNNGPYAYAVQAYGGTTNIYGGTFRTTGNTDTVIGAEGTSDANNVNIYGGYFEGNGMCVARVLGGKTGSETNGVVTTASNCVLNISGGMFVLAPNDARDSNVDAVIRCGGGTTYGTVNISGGTFINQHGDTKNRSSTVIFKNNAASSISITGGTFVMIDAANTTQTEHFYHVSAGFIESTGSVANKPTYHVTVFGEDHDGSTHVAVTAVAHATFSMGGRTYFATGALAGEFSAMEAGAQVRTTADSSGIRFVSTFSAETLDEIRAAAEEAGVTPEFGTVITTTSNIFTKANGLFTIEALGGIEQRGVSFVDIPAVNGITENEDGSMEIRAALVNIKPENYGLSYSAISYAKVGDTYYYSDFNFADNSRTIAFVAELALADTTGTLPCYDETGAPTGETTSKYTRYQQKVLYMYLGVDVSAWAD